MENSFFFLLMHALCVCVCVCAGVDGCVLHVDPKDAAQLVRHPHHHPSRRKHHLPGPVPLCLGAGVALGQPPAAQRAAHHQPCPGLVSLLGVVCAGCVICLSLATVTVFYSLFLDRSVRLGLCLVKLLCVLLFLLHTSTHMYICMHACTHRHSLTHARTHARAHTFFFFSLYT